jgi:PE family
MSFVNTHPESLASASAQLGAVGASMNAQSAAAMAPTTGVIPAAADEVSVMTAAKFAAHGQMYQLVSAKAAAVHQMLVEALGDSANAYAVTEAANAVATG